MAYSRHIGISALLRDVVLSYDRVSLLVNFSFEDIQAGGLASMTGPSVREAVLSTLESEQQSSKQCIAVAMIPGKGK